MRPKCELRSSSDSISFTRIFILFVSVCVCINYRIWLSTKLACFWEIFCFIPVDGIYQQQSLPISYFHYCMYSTLYSVLTFLLCMVPSWKRITFPPNKPTNQPTEKKACTGLENKLYKIYEALHLTSCINTHFMVMLLILCIGWFTFFFSIHFCSFCERFAILIAFNSCLWGMVLFFALPHNVDICINTLQCHELPHVVIHSQSYSILICL